MRRWVLAVAIILAGTLLFGSLPVSSGSEFAPGQILVKFKPGTPASAVAAAHRQNGSRVLDEIPQIGVQKLTAPRGLELARVRKYSANPNVEFAEADFIAYALEVIPNDPAFANWQWGLKYIQAPAAWDISRGSESVVIAVVDTGVDYTHPDLAGRILPGYDFYSGDSDPMDENGHGTQVTGIIGAVTNNGVGVAGVTWNDPILPVKIYSPTSETTYSVIAKGVTYAVDRGARVVNMSFGGPYASSTLKSAVDYAYTHGAVLAAGTGNSGALGVCYPAAYPNVLAVGASDGYDQRSSVSNYGPELDVLAPDVSMSTRLYGGYGTMGGTSMSTAYVSGLCGLILSVNPGLSPSEVMRIVRETADDIAPAGWDQYSGCGRINASGALVMASESAGGSPPDTEPPLVDLVSPADGAVVSGTVSVSASAGDNVGVAKVEFYADSQLIGAAAQPPFSVPWDTSRVSNGAKVLSAKAVDAAGNAGASSPISVTVSNASVTTYKFKGALSSKAPNAYHSISLSAPATVSASLVWSRADLDLYLLDAAGQVVASSATRSQPETISTGLLSAGSYKFKVVCVSGKARYTLNVTCTSQ
ncbi:MAG TPA: S8 family serine peptidase [Armatimonadota bacterium]|nr:S8 family serine peptidase [Armatimonadota bacterium]